MSNLEYEGTCVIKQHDFRLSEFNNYAVTTIAGGENIHWRITYHPTLELESRQVIIAIKHGRLGEIEGVPHVLTLGEKTEQEGIQCFVQPLKSPPSKSQLWTLEHVMPTKRHPLLMNAHIQSVEYPELLLGTGLPGAPLPRIFNNVSAARLGNEREKWTLDYVLLE